MARGKSLIHAWIRNEASKSVSQHASWLFAAFPEHESQNSHYNETCVHPIYLEKQLNKAECTYKGIPLFVSCLYGYRGNSPLCRVRCTTQDIIDDKTQTVTRSNLFHFTLSPSFSEEYILKEKLLSPVRGKVHSRDQNECSHNELSCSNVARSPLRGLRAYVWTVLKVCARLHVSATCLSSLLDLTYDYFHDFFAFNNEDGHVIIQINFVKEQNREKYQL